MDGSFVFGASVLHSGFCWCVRADRSAHGRHKAHTQLWWAYSETNRIPGRTVTRGDGPYALCPKTLWGVIA